MAVDPSSGIYSPDSFTNVRQVLDWIGSGTIGLVWRSGFGTVDPWTKSGQISSQAEAVAQAANRPANDLDYAQADSTVTATLKLNNADPSQSSLFSNNPGLIAAIDILKQLGYFLIAGGVIYLLIEALKLAEVL